MDRFPVQSVRRRFPALARGDDFVFFDNAAGAQVPQQVVDAVHDHLVDRHVQRGAPYTRSRQVDEGIERARERVATLVNAAHPDEIAFGMNATSFIRIISLGIAQSLGERRQIVVTDLDHEANIAAWLALEPFGAEIVWWHVRDRDGASPSGHVRDPVLHLDDLAAVLSSKTRVVACPLASNALGTKVDVAGVARLAHDAGADLFVDAVHYAPHGAIDVQQLECDYLVISGYKVFAPHMGFLWGRRERLNALRTFREDFIPDVTPAKFEVGTYVYENVAGMAAAVDYLLELGGQLGAGDDLSPRGVLLRALEAVAEYERGLSKSLIEALAAVPNVVIYGVTDRQELGRRVPTVCFTIQGRQSAAVASDLASREIGVRSGHMYAPRLMRRLGLSDVEGAVRVSLVHYNTVEEIARFQSVLAGG